MKKFAISLLALIAIAGTSFAFACPPEELPECTVYGDGRPMECNVE